MTTKYLRFRGAMYKLAEEPIDAHAVRDVQIFLNNDSKLSDMKFAIYKNLLTKLARGEYDHERAVAAFMYLVQAALAVYKEPYEGMVFDRRTREAIAQELRDSFEDWVRQDAPHERGMLPKKYRDVPLNL